MRLLTGLLICTLLLTACAPSQQSAIQTAIAKTQVVQTAIAVGVAQTLTAIAPTVTPIPPPTDTPLPPTITPRPSATPRPSLEAVALTFEDIGSILAGYFQVEYTDIKPDYEESLFGTGVFYGRTFQGKGKTGDIQVLLLQYDNENSASWQNSQAELYWTVKSVPIPPGVGLPAGSWMTETSVRATGERWLILGFNQGQVGVLLFWQGLPEGYDVTDASYWLALLGLAQQRRLQDGGYIERNE